MYSILDFDNLNNPGVYRFIGINPLNSKPNSPLYVGLAGRNSYKYMTNRRKKKAPQMLKGRLKRHLTNDAGVLGNLLNNIKHLNSD